MVGARGVVFWRGVAAGALVTVWFTAAMLWIEGWVVAVAAVLHTHSEPAGLAVIAALFLVHALLVLGLATSRGGLTDG